MSEIAWAAGFFDGEGTACFTCDRPSLQVGQTDRATLERFERAVDIGKIYGPYGNRSMERRDGYVRTPIYRWMALNDDARVAAALLYPFLMLKRAAIDRLGFPA